MKLIIFFIILLVIGILTHVAYIPTKNCYAPIKLHNDSSKYFALRYRINHKDVLMLKLYNPARNTYKWHSIYQCAQPFAAALAVDKSYAEAHIIALLSLHHEA